MITPLALAGTNHSNTASSRARRCPPGWSRSRARPGPGDRGDVRGVGMAVATFAAGCVAYLSGWLLLPAILLFSYLAGLMASWAAFASSGCSGPSSWSASSIPLAPGMRGCGPCSCWPAGCGRGAGRRVLDGHKRQPGTKLAVGRVRLLAGYAADSCLRPPRRPRPPSPCSTSRRSPTRTRCCALVPVPVPAPAPGG